MGTYTQAVQNLYVAYFSRPADPVGLTYWEGVVAANGGSTVAVSAAFSASAEYTAAFSGKSTLETVNQVYLNLFGHSADAPGLVYWAGLLAGGKITISNVVTQIAAGALGTDLVAYQSKVSAATSFTAAVDTAPELIAYSGTVANVAAKAWLAAVTDAATLATAVANIDASLAAIVTPAVPPVAGQTFTLTTGADTGTVFTGGGNDDSYISTIGTNGLAANGTTLNAGDVLNGGAGTDTLSISISGTNTAGVTTSALTLSGIENVSVNNYQTDDSFDNTINLAQATGVAKISVSSSAATGDTLFTAVRNIVTAEMANGSGDLSITYVDSAVAGEADAQTLNLAGQTGGEFTAAATSTGGIESLAIASTTSANTVKVTSSTLKSVTVTGDQNLTLTEGTTNTLTSVNAAALTGKLTFTTNDVTAIAITGGAGNDSISLGGTYTSDDSVNGGAGIDTLTISTSITAASDLANVSNIEKLVVTGGANITLAANVSPQTFTVSDASASIVTLNTGYTNATTVNLGVTDSVVNSANVALTANVTAANAISGAGISITGGTGVDELKITADGSAAFTLANVTSLDKITVVDGGDTVATAGADISITVGAAYATSLTVDASALDAGTVTSGTMNADYENLVFDGSLQTTAATVLNVTGGSGADTIIGGAGNDILVGGAGNDAINGSAGGADKITAGDGDDLITMGGALTSADTIDGGAGNDTLSVTSLSATGLTNVSNIETLSLSGAASAATLTANLSFTTIDMATIDDTAQVLTLSTGYTNATTVLIDGGDKVVNSANVALTVTANAGDLISATTITGGSGTDTLSVKADNTTANVVDMSLASALITGVDVVIVRDGGDVTSGTVTAGKDITINLASYATASTALTIDASALDAGTGTGLATNAEVLTITGVSARALNVTGGGASDTIVGSSSASGDILNGGAGNDTFTMGGNLTYLDSIDGGAGTDTITTTGAVTDIQFMKVSNVETLTLAASATLSSYFDTAAISTVNVSNTNTVDASGTAVGHTFVADASAGADSIVGGLGADTFVFAASTLTAADAVNGGAGIDTISLKNSSGAVTATVALTTSLVRNVENYTVANANGGDTVGSEDADAVSLTFDSSSSSTTAVLSTVDGSVITDTNDIFTVNASGVTDTDFTFNIIGGAAADVLKGGAAADTINGGGGADAITGGAGADVLTGGAGADTFIYATSDSKVSGADTITDFTTTSDKISIAVAMVGVTFDGTNKGTAVSNADALGLLSSKEGQYYFNTTSGQMIMDTDGNGLIQATDFALTMTGMTAIGASDIKFAVTGTAGADTIVTGGGADTITGGAGADVMTGGAGADTFVIAGADTGITVLTADTINDFKSSGADLLSLGAAGSATNFTAVSTAAANFAAVQTAADAAFAADAADAGGAKTYYVGNDGTNTYVFIDQGGNGVAAEDVVVLVGVVTVAAADIIA